MGLSGGGIFNGGRKDLKPNFLLFYVYSDYSPEASFTTSGSAPNQPDLPSLREATAHSLHIEWDKSTGDINGYTLEMDDEMKVGTGEITS